VAKKFRFRLIIFGSFISFLNASGSDDKNLLLFLTSPHLNLYYDISRHINLLPSFGESPYLWYLINIVGWYFIGWIIDTVIEALNRNDSDKPNL